MSTEPQELLHDVAKRTPHGLLARYATVLTVIVCLLFYGAGSIYYNYIDSALTGFADRISHLEAWQLCSEFRHASGGSDDCEVVR